MTDKALISELTWRSLDMQREAFPNMPHFIAPDEISSLLRPSRRQQSPIIHVSSLAVIADNERDFQSFMTSAWKLGAIIVSLEENTRWPPKGSIYHDALNAWKVARRDGAAKIGAHISAEKKKASTSERIARIKDRWPLLSKEVSTKALLAEAGLSLNTVKSILGSRIIAQHNYQAKLKRKATLKAKSDAKYPRMKRATHYIDERA